MGSMSDGLVLSHIQKHFAGVKALVDGSLEASRGEIHGLLGEDGADKSTMLRMLSGVITRDAGEVTLDGQPLAFRAPHEAAAHGIATVFQELSLIPDLSVEENLLFRLPFGWHGRLQARELRREFQATLERWEVRPARSGRQGSTSYRSTTTPAAAGRQGDERRSGRTDS